MKLFMFLILLSQLVFAAALIPDGTVTNSKLANDAVTSAKIAAGTIVSSDISASAAIPYSKLNMTGAITSSDLSTGAVTTAKLGAANYTLSSSTGATFSTGSVSYVDVTNLTATITTNGRPVMVRLQDDGAASGVSSSIQATANSTVGNPACAVNFLRGATTIAENRFDIYIGNITVSTGSIILSWPPSSASYIDLPSAGTYTAVVAEYFNTGSGSYTLSVTQVASTPTQPTSPGTRSHSHTAGLPT